MDEIAINVSFTGLSPGKAQDNDLHEG